jgi:hypothetical protein
MFGVHEVKLMGSGVTLLGGRLTIIPIGITTRSASSLDWNS